MRKNLRNFYFTLDLRSLALYRILAAAWLIVDWFQRWPDLEAFYTSFGFLPVDSTVPRSARDFHFSLLDSVVSLPMVQIAFGLGLLCYLGLLIGYRTKLFQILSFLFYVSVLNRNNLVNDGGDLVMVTLLFWCLFLPLGQRFSVDAILDRMKRGVELRNGDIPSAPPPARSDRSLAAFVVVFQIGLIYFLTAFLKHGDKWKDGTALYYALKLEYFATPLGSWLEARPLWLIQIVSWGTLAIEFAAGQFILLPVAQPTLRRLAILALTGLHLGIWCTMSLASFSLAMIASYVLLLLPEDWEVIRRFTLRWSRPVTVFYDADCGFCARCCQWAALADPAGRLHFRGNQQLAADPSLAPGADIRESVVVMERPEGRPLTKSQAAAAIFRALPLPFHVFRVIAWPGIARVSDWAYDRVARNRQRLSLWFGLTACRMPNLTSPNRAPASESTEKPAMPDRAPRVSQGSAPTPNRWSEAPAELPPSGPAPLGDPPPMIRVWRLLGRGLRDLAVAIVFGVILIRGYNLNMTPRLNTRPIDLPPALLATVYVPQMDPYWPLFAPNPTTDEGWWVIVGITESGESYDPLTGQTPTFEKPARFKFDRHWFKAWESLWQRDIRYWRLFGEYLARKNRREKPEGQRLRFFDAYYLIKTTLPPGSAEPYTIQRNLVWRQECSEE